LAKKKVLREVRVTGEKGDELDRVVLAEQRGVPLCVARRR
jgi:hypothetical protein